MSISSIFGDRICVENDTLEIGAISEDIKRGGNYRLKHRIQITEHFTAHIQSVHRIQMTNISSLSVL